MYKEIFFYFKVTLQVPCKPTDQSLLSSHSYFTSCESESKHSNLYLDQLEYLNHTTECLPVVSSAFPNKIFSAQL